MTTPASRRQQGLALVVALIFLIVISIIGVSAVKFTTAGVRSALNDEYRVASFQDAQSLMDATVADSDNTPVVGGVGYRVCTPGAVITDGNDCETSDIALPEGLFDGELEDGQAQATVTRLSPLFGPPPRGSGASVNRFFAANFRIQAQHDKTDVGAGRTTINEGLILILNRT